MNSLQHKWEERRSEHRFYAEILAEITPYPHRINREILAEITPYPHRINREILAEITPYPHRINREILAEITLYPHRINRDLLVIIDNGSKYLIVDFHFNPSFLIVQVSAGLRTNEALC